ncbi:MAG: Clp protease N-terminal domain-containing protein [Planctomycetota bacterium]
MNTEQPFKNATDPALAIIAYATEDAFSRGGASPDTLDILRAMYRVPGTIAKAALEENEIEESEIPVGLYPEFDEVTLEVLSAQCEEEARQLGHTFPGTEHLLLAICCSASTRGAKLLRQFNGLDQRESVCRTVVEILGNDWTAWRDQHSSVFS